MASTGQVVQSFMGAMGKGDFTEARSYLHDYLSFRGPIDTFDKPEPYLQALEKLHKMVERVDMKKMFVAGNDVWGQDCFDPRGLRRTTFRGDVRCEVKRVQDALVR